jgi:hypothetical protein
MTNSTHTTEDRLYQPEYNGPEWDPVRNKPVPVKHVATYRELTHMWVRLDWRQLDDADLLAERRAMTREQQLLELELEDEDPEAAYLAERALELLEIDIGEVDRIGRARNRLARQEGTRIIPHPGDLSGKFAAARQLDLVEVLGTLGGQDPVRRGDSHWIRCPFHGGGHERTPSLQIYPGDRGWFCHSCRVGGDAVTFVVELKGMSRVSALRFLEQMFDFPEASHAKP